jgi:hypothetical protein
MRTFPVVMAALTVAAISLSPAASYAQMVRFGHIDHTPSGEVLKLHASNHAVMEQALTQPDLPPFASPSPDDGSVFYLEPLPDRVG